MRIVIAGQTYDPKINGQGVFTLHLAEGLARRGHEVVMIAPSDQGRAHHTVAQGVQIYAVSAVSLAPLYRNVSVTPWPSRPVGAILDHVQPEIVHLQDHYPLCRGVLRAARKRNLPIVGTNHFLPENMAPYIPFSRYCRTAVEGFLWRTVLDVLNQVHLVTTPTETAAAILRAQQIRVPVRAISCGIDLDGFFPDPHVDRSELRRRYGLDPTRTLFLYVGRLDREKRIDVLIQAFERLNRDDLQLGIAGQGRHGSTLRAQAERLTRSRRVVFTGFVPAADLRALLNSADLFAMPSEAELQSIATLEAMATGRPVLAADARALPELVRSGVNGCLFRAGDVEDACRRITQLADERARWAMMGEASLAIARSHSLGSTLHRYEELYRCLQAACLAGDEIT
jgi:1,2-diacylglycerol 3-alpha-glucosyltransferase